MSVNQTAESLSQMRTTMKELRPQVQDQKDRLLAYLIEQPEGKQSITINNTTFSAVKKYPPPKLNYKTLEQAYDDWLSQSPTEPLSAAELITHVKQFNRDQAKSAEKNWVLKMGE